MPDAAPPADPLLSLAGRTALVTGGTRGIGQAIAAVLLDRGAQVFITGRSQAASEAAAEELDPSGRCRGLAAELDTPAAAQALAERLGRETDGLDILVHNAGTGSYAPFDDFSETDWDQVMDLNLKSAFFLAQALHPLLRARATAAAPSRLINIGSAGAMQFSSSDSYAYGASKAGLNWLTRKLARRLAGEHITVNVVSPGPVDAGLLLQLPAETLTRMKEDIPLGRFATAEEVAQAVLFLASPMGAYLTGVILPVDGGLTGCMR